MSKQQVSHLAPFNLRAQNNFFGGWPVLKDTDEEFAIVIAMPIEGWQDSAAVVVSQSKGDVISAEAFGVQDGAPAIKQALAALSLDVDDTGWQAVGKQDTVIQKLQEKYNYLRPILFHSPYEAAAGFVIGQRISIKQRQAIQKKMAEQLGDKITIEGQAFAAFPKPQVLLDLQEFPGLNDTKIQRLHGVAQATLGGKLDRAKLLAMKPTEALEFLQSLPGIGPFYASGILHRGAGVVDDVTDDAMTKIAVQQAYGLDHEPSQAEVLKLANNWKPYRMWAEVLVHIWLRREGTMPKKDFRRK